MANVELIWHREMCSTEKRLQTCSDLTDASGVSGVRSPDTRQLLHILGPEPFWVRRAAHRRVRLLASPATVAECKTRMLASWHVIARCTHREQVDLGHKTISPVHDRRLTARGEVSVGNESRRGAGQSLACLVSRTVPCCTLPSHPWTRQSLVSSLGRRACSCAQIWAAALPWNKIRVAYPFLGPSIEARSSLAQFRSGDRRQSTAEDSTGVQTCRISVLNASNAPGKCAQCTSRQLNRQWARDVDVQCDGMNATR